jgi:hypothetical protein
VEDLTDGSILKITHDTTLGAVGPIFQAPASSTVVHWNAKGRVEDSTKTGLECVRDVQKLTNVCLAREWNISKGRIIHVFPVVAAASYLGVLVNVVCEGVVLLMHDAFMLSKFTAKDASVKETKIVYPLGLESVSVKKLVLAGKGKALKLETVEKVERNKDGELFKSKTAFSEWEYLQSVNGIGGHCHDGKVRKEPLDAFCVGFFHETNQDPIIQDAIMLLAFRVLDISRILFI